AASFGRFAFIGGCERPNCPKSTPAEGITLGSIPLTSTASTFLAGVFFACAMTGELKERPARRARDNPIRRVFFVSALCRGRRVDRRERLIATPCRRPPPIARERAQACASVYRKLVRNDTRKARR